MATAYQVILQGSQEVPANASTASGLGTLVYDDAATRLSYSVTVAGLDFGDLLDGGADETPSPADDVNGGHIHSAARGANGAVRFNLFTQDADDFAHVENPDGTRTLSGAWETTDPASASITLFAAMLAGGVPGSDIDLYLNIHTTTFPGGEIRGQLVAISNDAANTVNGTAGDDWLPGLGGDDTLNGLGGNDTLDGGDANDTLIGGAGIDTTIGGAGDDVHIVNSAADVVIETAGGGAADRVASSVSYTLAAAADVELLTTTSAAGLAAINLTGNALSQTITGNAGDNLLTSLSTGAAADILRGLGGNDTYRVYSALDQIVETAGQGTADKAVASVSYTLAAGVDVEFLQTNSSAGLAAINLTGNALAQTITGNAGANTLSDGGGAGADILRGREGNDVYIVRNSGTVVVETAGGGAVDRVSAGVDYVLAAAAQVEQLNTTSAAGTAAIDLTGNAFVQMITGNAGANILNGREGADQLRGLGGADSFVFDTALSASNIDKILDFVVADDTIVLDQTIFAALPTGALDPLAFEANTTGNATTAASRVVYQTTTGNLYYDADGSAAGARQQFANLTASLALTAADFFVIA